MKLGTQKNNTFRMKTKRKEILTKAVGCKPLRSRFIGSQKKVCRDKSYLVYGKNLAESFILQHHHHHHDISYENGYNFNLHSSLYSG
jgi:hypothetical protein